MQGDIESLIQKYGITGDKILEQREFLKQHGLIPQGYKLKDEEVISVILSLNPHYRINNWYFVKDERGRKTPFQQNYVQEFLFNNQWWRNLILKSRQHGCTTEICIEALDLCLHTPYLSAGIVAQTEGYARNIFDDKIKFAYDNCHEDLKKTVRLLTDRNDMMKFSNGSSIYVDCSLRSMTVQFLLVSEFGEICINRPDRADEIVSGAFNTLHAGSKLFVESTGKGATGHFYDYAKEAEALSVAASSLNHLQFKFFFFGWYCDPKNQMPADSVVKTKEDDEYFIKIEPDIRHLSKQGVILPMPNDKLSEDQKAWYVEKSREQKDNMKSQHPSTPDEAFQNIAEGRYFRTEIAKVREEKRIRFVPYEKNFPVNTGWDFGKRGTAIWFHQHIHGENRFINYYENINQGFEHFVKKMQSFGYYAWGTHYLPHDATTGRMGKGSDIKSYEEILWELGIRNTLVVKRTQNKVSARDEASNFFSSCFFDEKNTKIGFSRLENYRRKYDRIQGCWLEDEFDDENVHGSDAFICLANGFSINRGTSKSSEYIKNRKTPNKLAFR